MAFAAVVLNFKQRFYKSQIGLSNYDTLFRFLPIFLRKYLLAVSPAVSSSTLSLLERTTRYATPLQLEEIVQNRSEIVEEFADVVSAALDHEVIL